MSNATLTIREAANTAVLSFPEPLPFGFYEVFVARTVRDVAGNALTNDFRSHFAQLASGTDGDDDGDGLTNAEEIRYGSNPLRADTDGDGWNDEAENTEGTDARDPASHPRVTAMARPPLLMEVPSASLGIGGNGLHLARPPLNILIPSPETDGSAGRPAHIARPPVKITPP